MTHKPDHWTAMDLDIVALHESCPVGRAPGWTFWQHPTLGDEHPILAVSLDYIDDSGPIVWNTHDFDVPDHL